MASSCGILNIGTEITSGEIVNTNVAWMAERLEDFGFEVQRHVAVPDDRQKILQALEYLAKGSDHIFISGGLGPTSDDLTRDVVAEFLGVPLEFSEPVKINLVEKLAKRGVPLREGHLRQCYFPAGAEILENRVGTAAGIWLKAPGKAGVICILPGPPRELRDIWENEIEQRLRLFHPTADRRLVHYWTLGEAESEIAERVEAAVAGSGLTVGYRAHPPYVIVKLWVPQHRDEPADQRALQRVRETLSPSFAGSGDVDPALPLYRELIHVPHVIIRDQVTGGRVWDRLRSTMHRPAPLPDGFSISLYFGAEEYLPPEEKAQIVLGIDQLKAPLADDWAEARLSFINAGRPLKERTVSQREVPSLLRSRGVEYWRIWCCEQALIFWWDQIKSLGNQGETKQ